MIFGTNNAVGLPLSYQYSFDGTVPSWGTFRRELNRIVSISSLNNSAESVDNTYQISDLEISFADNDGSVWNSLGKGTNCLNKDVSFQVYFGGSADFSSRPPNEERLSLIQNQVPITAQLFPLHTGKITKVRRSERLVTVTSKSRMRLLGDLTWNYPFFSRSSKFTPIGTFYFKDGNTFSKNDFLGSSRFNEQGDAESFNVIARVATVNKAYTGTLDTYLADYGRGYETFDLASGYNFYGSQFTWDFPKVSLNATYLQKFDGTVGVFDDYSAPTGTEIADANRQANEL